MPPEPASPTRDDPLIPSPLLLCAGEHACVRALVGPPSTMPQPTLPETRLRVAAVLSWPRYRPSLADVADSIRENSHSYDGLASGFIYFLSRDPAVATTRSPYGYVGGNPLNATDPSGECGLWGNDTCWGDVAGWVNKNVIQPLGDFGSTHVFQLCISATAPNLVGAGGPWGAVGGSFCLTGNTHHFGIMVSSLQAPHGFSLGLGLEFNAADACDPRQLQGPFRTIGGNVGPAFGSVYGEGNDINGVAGGLGVGFPVGGYQGTTYSRYFPLWN